MEEVSTSAVCEYTTECEGVGFQCIDRRCMCNPLWAHAGPNCDELRWASWGLVVILTLVSIFSVTVLATAAKSLKRASSFKCGSGLLQLGRMLFQWRKASDSGSTTIRVVLLSVLFNIISYSW
ncbi:unnamed protein product, partial [Ectocarpus sp. 12 AP-2014]